MIFAISKFIAGLFGLDISKVQRWVVIGVVAIGLILVIALGLWLKACFTKTPKIDQEQINRINAANEKERKAELRNIVEENAEAINTADNRMTIAETNVVERNREIDVKVQEASNKIAEAKKQGRDVTQEELECILTGNCS